MLNSSADQEAALAQLMGEQQDKTSANYHKWLTPETFGASFGPAAGDIAKVVAWLQDQGLSVESVAKSGRIVTFSGNAGQVEAAFKTQISSVQIEGETYFSNTTDISIPQALAPVIAGIARVNNIFPKHTGNHTRVSTVQIDAEGNGFSPLYGASTGTHYVTPGDAAVIYNTTPLYTAGIDGTGMTVGIIAQSNIDLADVEEFRSMFGLKKNDPTITIIGQNPGVNQDDVEAYLDAEWGGAEAPGAAVNFIVSGPSLEDGGIDGAALYAVESNSVDIISMSYGGGETSNGASGTAFWNILWEQAASQGQTVFISTGDSGAAGCDLSSNTYETGGYCVNALGSSAFNVAMGGSIFIDWNPAQYWGASGGTSIPFANALSYVPEGTVNQGRLTNDYLNANANAYSTGSGIFSDGGGISIYTARPSWQTGSGIPTNTDIIGTITGTGTAPGSPISGLHRLVPDLVNISANGHDGTLFCAGSICSVSNTGTLNNAGVIGGTSVATPVQAGMQALINEKNGGRQGNILPILYQLANTQYTASTTACQAVIGTTTTSTPTLPASTCNFHDVITGSNIVPSASTGTAGIGFTAQAGFDEASGLGSMNVANVANNWASVSLTATTTTFTLSPSAGVTHGGTQNLTVNVAPSSGAGTPTGDVSLIAVTATPSGPRMYTLTGGAFSGTVSSGSVNQGNGANPALPAGTYNVYIHYAGDGKFAPSNSASIPVTINKEGTSVGITPYNVTVAGAVNVQTTFAYGADVYLDTFVTAASNGGSPTGAVTFTLTRNGGAYGTLTTNLDGSGNTYFLSGQAFYSFYLKPNFAALAPGSYVATASYAGDSSFTTSTSSIAFTVQQETPSVTFTVPVSISAGGTAVFGYSIANPATLANANSTVPATGTVTFTDTTTSTSLGSCTLAAAFLSGSTLQSAICSFSTTAITVTGANVISAAYSGDTNYAAATNTGTVTVGSLTASTLNLTGTGTATVGYVYTLKATMSPTAATGTVSFFDASGTTFLGQCTLASGICSLALGSTATGYGILTAGTHAFSATYSGSSTYASSTGTFNPTIAQSTTAITLSAPSSSIYGQPVLMSVYLTRSEATGTAYAAILQPTGVVNFYDSTVSTTTPIATGTLAFDPAGYGYYISAGTTTALPAGSNTITATYVGDANFKTSTAALTPVTTVAAQTPVIKLTSPGSVYNGTTSISLTATIPGTSVLAAPSGSITFYDGNTSLGTATASYNATAGAFTATYTATGVAGGAHSYKAVLAADSNYNTAASNVLPVVLNTNNIWIANGNGTVSGLTPSGTAVTSAVSGGGTAVRIDNLGDVWSLNKTGNSAAEFGHTGALLGTYTTGGVNAPTALAIDGGGIVWITNGNNTLTGLTTAGTAVNPAAYSTPLATPTSINVDASGNLWITNSGDNSVTKVIGIATPAMTPQTTAVQSATPAVKP